MKQPWRSHYNAICGDWVAKHKRTTRNGVGNCSSKTGSRRQSTILKHFLKGFLEGKSLAPKKTHFVRDFLQNSIGNSSTSTTCNPIYIAGTILQLQITMEFCRPHMHEKHLKPHLQCGTDPRIRPWSDHIETVSHPSHPEVDHRGRTLYGKTQGFVHLLSLKNDFVRDFLQNSIGNSSTSTTCNPIYIAGTILQLQITMELCRPHMHEKHLKPHLQCGTDPRMIRPWSDHTRDRLAPVAPQR